MKSEEPREDLEPPKFIYRTDGGIGEDITLVFAMVALVGILVQMAVEDFLFYL